MKDWLSVAELAGLPGLPRTRRGVQLYVNRHKWTPRDTEHREFSINYLSGAQKLALMRRESREIDPARDLAAAGDRAPAGRAAPAPLGTALSEAQQDLLDQRFELVQRYEEFRRANSGTTMAALKQFAAIEGTPWPTLHRWVKRYLKDGVAGLIDQRGRPKGGKVVQSVDMQESIIAMVIQQPVLSARQIRHLIEPSFNGATPSTVQIQRFIRKWTSEHRAEMAAMTNPREFNNRYRVAVADAAAGITRFGELLEIDATPADAHCVDGRHAIIGMIDVASRTTRWRVSKTVTSVAVGLLLREWIREFGVPEAVHGDNGKEFVARHTQRILAALEVAWNPSLPYAPWQKPFIERANGTMSHDLLPLLPGYRGANVAQAQAIRERLSMAARRGKTDRTIFEVSLTGEQLQAHLDNWARNIYGDAPHSELARRTPNEVAAELLRRSVKRAIDDRVLDQLMAQAPGGDGLRVVTKKGVSIDGVDYIADELVAHIGQRVHAYFDPRDLGEIAVYSSDHQFVCVAINPERKGIDRGTMALMMREAQDRFTREHRAEGARLKKKINLRRVADAYLQAHADSATAVTLVPAREAEEVRTRTLDAVADAVAAREPAAAAPMMTDAEHERLDASVRSILSLKRGAYDEEAEAEAIVARYQKLLVTPREQRTQSDLDFLKMVEPLPEIQALRRRVA